MIFEAHTDTSMYRNDKLKYSICQIDVKMSVQYMSFSAHADAKGIMQLIRHCEPKNIMLVHGEAAKMEFLNKKIEQEFGKYVCSF